MVTEHYLRYWQEANGLTYTALRYGNVYGPRQDPNGEAGVIAIFAKRFLNHDSVRIDWDGEQQKDYVFVEDVARANVLAIDHGDNLGAPTTDQRGVARPRDGDFNATAIIDIGAIEV